MSFYSTFSWTVRRDRSNQYFWISWCKLSTSARKGIIFSLWLLIMKATGFDFVCHIEQSHTISYIYEILCGMDSYDKWNAPSCVLCALHSHLSSRLHLFMTTLISFKTVFHTDQHWKRKNPQMGPWCQFEDWHLTTLLQRKANRGLAQNRKSPTARKTLCACMNSCLSRFGHPERKHGPGQPEIFPRDSYHLSAKSRLNNRPGAGPETLIYLVRKRP